MSQLAVLNTSVGFRDKVISTTPRPPFAHGCFVLGLMAVSDHFPSDSNLRLASGYMSAYSRLDNTPLARSMSLHHGLISYNRSAR